MKFLYAGILLFFAVPLYAQEVHQELQETVRAEVLKILNSEPRDIIGTDTEAIVQEVLVQIKEGERKGDQIRFENDLMELQSGDSIYVNRLVSIDGVEYYAFKDVDRTKTLFFLVLSFAAVLVLFSGKHGVRALVSLALSIGILFYVLVPLLLAGCAPVLVCVLVSAPMLAMMLFMTHGLRSQTYIALMGTFGAVVITGILATVWVELARFTGLSSDAAIYLNFSTKGGLDFGGILLGSIIIGILGVLDDVSITQASVVAELKRANQKLGLWDTYTRALRVGRDHIGSLVNTLAFAYVGVALPLVLLLVKAESGLVLSLNQEMVAVELVRIFVGSIGLILAVPLTTLIAAVYYNRYTIDKEDPHHVGHLH